MAILALHCFRLWAAYRATADLYVEQIVALACYTNVQDERARLRMQDHSVVQGVPQGGVPHEVAGVDFCAPPFAPRRVFCTRPPKHAQRLY